MKLNKTIKYHNGAYHVIISLQWSDDGLTEKEKEIFESGAVVPVDLGGRFEADKINVEFYMELCVKKFPFKSELRQVFKPNENCSLERANLKAIVYCTEIKDRLINARDRLVAEHSRQKQHLVDHSYYDGY